ncbi:hypothetical protein T4C_11352, partial [Trichinella pseudospiralis]
LWIGLVKIVNIVIFISFGINFYRKLLLNLMLILESRIPSLQN